MSKPPNSASRSRSRSRSYTRSHSRSRSRSRSRKRRYSSRSRSRSHSRERNYPSRDFQSNRGYNRGFRGYRRPFQYNRGRGRGYFPRGNYQRGGGQYGYRSNNWHGHRDQQQPYDHSYSPRRGRSRSRSPRKRSRSRSRHSERSSSGHSRHSSSSSHSSSPRRRNSSSGKPRSKDIKGRGSPGEAKEAPKPAEGTPEEPTSKWERLTDYDASPKRSGSTASAGGQSEVKVALLGAGNGGPLWRSIGPASKSPPPKTSASTGFGFFSKEDLKAGDKSASISTAFKKFLAEQKKPLSDKDNGRGEALSSGDADNEKTGVKSRGIFETSESGYDGSKTEKGLPFLDAEEDQYRQEMKDRKSEEEPKYKDKVMLSVRDLGEERFGKWDDSVYLSNKDSSRRDEDVDEELDEQLYRSRKHASKKEEKASKKKEKKKSRISPSSPSPSRGSENRGRPLFPAAKETSPSPKATVKRDSQFNFSIKAFTDDGESSSLAKERHLSRDLVLPDKKDHEEFRSIFQSAQLLRSPSELFAQHIVTIVHHIKAQHFQSSGLTLSERFGIYQRKAAEMEMMRPRKSPEIHRRIDVSPSAFKKHSHLFEEFDESGCKDYGKKHEGDSLDLRLDIERRKKEPKRERAKSSAGSRTPSHELSPERSSKHKKSKKSKKKRERSPSSSSSSSSSPSPRVYRGREHHMEDHMEGGGGFNKARLGSREFPGPRDYEGHMDRGYERGRGGYDRGGYDRGRGGYDRGFPRIRGRGWNRGNYPGNNTNNNPQNVAGPSRPPEEEWDPEYTPKSRKYFQHDDRDKEGEMKWLETRGRGRGSYPRSRGTFIIRKGGGSPKWTHDMFPGNTEEGDMGDGSADHSLKDEDKPGDNTASKS